MSDKPQGYGIHDRFDGGPIETADEELERLGDEIESLRARLAEVEADLKRALDHHARLRRDLYDYGELTTDQRKMMRRVFRGTYYPAALDAAPDLALDLLDARRERDEARAVLDEVADAADALLFSGYVFTEHPRCDALRARLRGATVKARAALAQP